LIFVLRRSAPGVVLGLLLAGCDADVPDADVDQDVGCEPDIFVVQDGVDFGILPQTGEGHRGLDIENRGCQRLDVFAVTMRDAAAVVVDTEDDFLLEEGEAMSLDLVWAPSGEAAWNLASTLEIQSNDPDEQLVEVPVEGEIAD
jgi:hypothetical protein